MQNQGFRPFASEAVSGAFWERFFANLDPQIGPKSTPGGVLGPLGGVLGPLGAPCGVSGRPGGVSGASRVRPGPSWGRLGASWGRLGPSWGRLGAQNASQHKPVLACEREAR